MDWVQYFIFGLFTLMVLGGGLMVVTLRNIVQAAGALVLTLFGVAGLYVLLEAGFLAAVQILVYIGAIAILIVFATMLTCGMMLGRMKISNFQSGISGVVAVLLLGLAVRAATGQLAD